MNFTVATCSLAAIIKYLDVSVSESTEMKNKFHIIVEMKIQKVSHVITLFYSISIQGSYKIWQNLVNFRHPFILLKFFFFYYFSSVESF